MRIFMFGTYAKTSLLFMLACCGLAQAMQQPLMFRSAREFAAAVKSEQRRRICECLGGTACCAAAEECCRDCAVPAYFFMTHPMPNLTINDTPISMPESVWHALSLYVTGTASAAAAGLACVGYAFITRSTDYHAARRVACATCRTCLECLLEDSEATDVLTKGMLAAIKDALRKNDYAPYPCVAHHSVTM